MCQLEYKLHANKTTNFDTMHWSMKTNQNYQKKSPTFQNAQKLYFVYIKPKIHFWAILEYKFKLEKFHSNDTDWLRYMLTVKQIESNGSWNQTNSTTKTACVQNTLVHKKSLQTATKRSQA